MEMLQWVLAIIIIIVNIVVVGGGLLYIANNFDESLSFLWKHVSLIVSLVLCWGAVGGFLLPGPPATDINEPVEEVFLTLSLPVLSLGYAIAARFSKRNPTEILTTFTALMVTVVFVWAGAYSAISESDASSFTEELSRTDALYFAVTTFTANGTGDIGPTSDAARGAVTGQIVGGFLIVSVAIGSLTSSLARVRREVEPNPPPPTSA